MKKKTKERMRREEVREVRREGNKREINIITEGAPQKRVICYVLLRADVFSVTERVRDLGIG